MDIHCRRGKFAAARAEDDRFPVPSRSPPIGSGTRRNIQVRPKEDSTPGDRLSSCFPPAC